MCGFGHKSICQGLSTKKATDAMKAKIIQQINAYNHLDYHIQEPKYRIEDVPNGVLFSFLRIGKEDFIDMESSQISHTLTTYRVNAKIPPVQGYIQKNNPAIKC